MKVKLNILVTGGAGYIGSIMVPHLLNEGHFVTVLDNFMFNQSSLNQCCHFSNFKIVKGDIRVKDTISKLLKKSDIIIPLAALVGAPMCNNDPVGATTTNFTAVKEMLDLVSNDQFILMPTTNSAYGSGNENNFCDEESPLKPISKYALDKVEIEKLLMDHPNFISFRLATVFGMSPRMRIDLLVNDFTYRAVYDRYVVLFESQFKRNYIHVQDVTRVFIHAINHLDEMKNNVFNVGLSNANISKKELCIIIKEKLPEFSFFESNLGKDPDQRNYIVSNSKIEKTGFIQKFSLNDGIDELIKGYQMLNNKIYGNI